MTIETQIREFISQNILFSENGFPYPDDVSFIQEGIIDSIGMLELVAFVEENFQINVVDQEIIPANFDSVNNLAVYIRRKSGD